MGIEDEKSTKDIAAERAEKAGFEWLTRTLSRMECSGFATAAIFAIVSRIQGDGEGQVSQKVLLGDLSDLGPEGFFEKYKDYTPGVTSRRITPSSNRSGFLHSVSAESGSTKISKETPKGSVASTVGNKIIAAAHAIKKALALGDESDDSISKK